MSESLRKTEVGPRLNAAALLDRRRRLELDRLALKRRAEERALPLDAEETLGGPVSGIGPIAWWRRLESDRLALVIQAQQAGLLPGPGAEGAGAGASTMTGMGAQATQVMEDVQKSVLIVKDRVALYASLGGILDIPPVLLALHLHKLAYDTKLKKAADGIQNFVNTATGGKGGGGQGEESNAAGGMMGGLSKGMGAVARVGGETSKGMTGGGMASAGGGLAGGMMGGMGAGGGLASPSLGMTGGGAGGIPGAGASPAAGMGAGGGPSVSGGAAAMAGPGAEAAGGGGGGEGGIIQKVRDLASSKVAKMVQRVKDILLAEWMLLFLVDGILGALILLLIFQVCFFAYMVMHPLDFSTAILVSVIDYIESFF